MAITITAKLDSKGVTDGAKEVVDSVKEMGTEAEKSNDKLVDTLSDVSKEIDGLKKKDKELRSELERLGDDGGDAASKLKSDIERIGTSLLDATRRADALSAEIAAIDSGGMENLNRVASELFGQIGELKERTEALKSELASMAASGVNSLGRVEDAAEEAADAVDSVGSGSTIRESITAISTGYLAVVDIMGKAVEAGKKVVEVVNILAEDGNPAAVELANSFGEVKASLLELAENPIFQNAFSEIADVINQTVIPSIREIPGTVFEMVLMTQKQIFSLKESLGMIPEGSVAMLETMQEVARDAYHLAEEAGKKNREERKRLEEVAKVDAELAKIRAAKNADEVKSAIEQIKTEAELRDVIDDLTESIRDEAYERKLSDEERAAAVSKIAMAEDRLKRLRDENAASEKSTVDESLKIKTEAAKETERINKEQADKKKQLDREMLEAERRNIEERKRLVMGGDVKGAEQLLGSQTREQVREAYARQQSEGASLAATFSGMSEKEVARERQRALANARRQFDNGTANSADIRNAQVELAGQAADSAVAQGKVSKETAQATKEAIAELARTQNELGQVQAEMENMRKIMGSISQGANRRRAQVAGGRQ